MDCRRERCGRLRSRGREALRRSFGDLPTSSPNSIACRRHGESRTALPGNLAAFVRSPRRAIDVFRGRDLIEAGLNEAAAGFARQGLWGLYFYGLADVVAWRGGERRLVV